MSFKEELDYFLSQYETPKKQPIPPPTNPLEDALNSQWDQARLKEKSK